MPAKDALNVIGTRQPRLDGPEKCSGKSIFGDDVVLPGMLCGKILRSSHAHARILSIDTSKAEALPGVKAVITAADAEGIMGSRRGQEPVFCTEITTYKGEEIAAVAALDEVTAEKALRLIEVEYEELPSVENMRRARIKGAPQVHPDKPGNIWSDVVDTYGEPDEAFAEADLIYEEKLNASVTHNLFAEFHVAVPLVCRSARCKLFISTPAAHFRAAVGRGHIITLRRCCRARRADRSRFSPPETKSSWYAGHWARTITRYGPPSIRTAR
jgi:4-hydroxybenzoyl-CoA reductase subunit alpha